MYLAISKIFYWFNVIGELARNDWEDAGTFVINRILNQDLPIILVVACLVIIDMSKGKFWTKIAIGYVAYIGILVVYSVSMAWIFDGDPMAGLTFFRDSFVTFTIQFAIIAVILQIKESFMKKVKETPAEGDEEQSP